MRFAYLSEKTNFVAVRPARRATTSLSESLMTKLENRCANCGRKFGLVCHHHWGLRFCRKACKDNFLAKTAKDHACMRKWFGSLARGTT
jgi:ribosomal protein S14